MTSVKKGKLLITLLIFALICILVPIIINATINRTATISSSVSFRVQDIEGKFGYGIFGSAKGENNGTSFQPTLFFESGLNPQTQIIEIKDANGEFFTSTDLQLDLGDLSLDDKHRKIDLYFFFVNTAVFEGYNNRTITLSFADNSDFKSYDSTVATDGLSSAWQYTVVSSDSANYFNLEMFNTATARNWTNLSMSTTVPVEPATWRYDKTDPYLAYNMAIIKYTLTIGDGWDANNTFGENKAEQPKIDLTINFNSASEGN